MICLVNAQDQRESVRSRSSFDLIGLKWGILEMLIGNPARAILRTMRHLSIGLLLFSSLSFAVTQTTIRQVDFKNFSYPWTEYTGWPHELEWLDTSDRHYVRLVSGRWQLDTEHQAGDQGNVVPFSGLTLEGVEFGDVTGHGAADAIVVLRFDTGGTMYFHYVYIYSFAARRPRLLAYFRCGDRAASGLYRVYGQDGKLVIELFDAEKREGDCCSSGFIRTRYQWHNGRFSPVGSPESGKPSTPSRLPVNLFGMDE